MPCYDGYRASSVNQTSKLGVFGLGQTATLLADWIRFSPYCREPAAQATSGISTLRRPLKSDAALACDARLFKRVHLVVGQCERVRLLLVA